MTVLSLLPSPPADIASTHSLHHDRFIEFMAISVIIESIKFKGCACGLLNGRGFGSGRGQT